MRKALFALPLLASALILPRTAHADTTDLFTLTGDSNTYTFTLPQQFTFPVEPHLVTVPAPTTTGTINGVGGQTFNIDLYTGIGNTGESLSFAQVGVLAGPTLISFVSSTGNTSTAAIDPGSYRLIDYAHSITGPDYYNLTITPETTPPPAPAVPEPATLILLSTGALALLLATRSSRPSPEHSRSHPSSPYPAQRRVRSAIAFPKREPKKINPETMAHLSRPKN